MSFGVVLTAPAYCSKACLEWAQRVGYHTVNKEGLLMTRTDSPGAMNSPSNDG